jgi:hypothetical protein
LRESSLLGSKIGRSGDILRESAFSQVDDYQHKFSRVSGLYDSLFKNLVVDKFDTGESCKTARRFFGKDTINFVGIDGTEYSKPLFDMIIFYAGAYSCEGTINFSEEKEKLEVKYQNRFMDQGKDISSCVPVYVDKVPDIDQTFLNRSQGQVNLMKALTEEVIIDNTNVANFLMTFSEFYLAYKFAASSKKCDLIFLDRSLSNMYSSLMYDTSCRRAWQTNCSILNIKIDNVPIDINDLTIARHNIINDILELPPARGDYLRYAILFNLLKQQQQHEGESQLDFESICQQLKLGKDEKKRKRAQRYIDKSVEEKLIEGGANGKYSLSERYVSTWSRIKKLVNKVGEQIFQGNKEPFMIQSESGDGKKKDWITTLDLAFLTLFSFYMLIEECWKNNILLIGITKDTVAHDFKNHVIPICISNQVWTNNLVTNEDLNNVPNTDRMLLQSMSMLNHDCIHIPWGLIEYDAAFVMAIPDFKKRKGYVSGAIKNKIIPSQLFLRSFVQLEKSKRDDLLRSNVLAIDRLVYPAFDLASTANDNGETVTEFIHDYAGEESVKFLLFKDNKVRNDIQNLVINILKAMGSPSIAEAFGHNKALYIADKVAKWHNEQFRKIVESTGSLILCDKGLRNFVFYMNTFRERRQALESNR